MPKAEEIKEDYANLSGYVAEFNMGLRHDVRAVYPSKSADNWHRS